MAHEIDPYRPVFAELEAADNPATADAYSAYRTFVADSSFDPCIYVSMAITSGGYVRDQGLNFGEALARNGAHGLLVADALTAQYGDLGVQRSDVVVPASLGKVAGWGQADYLLFWSHVITGIDPALACDIDGSVRATDITNAPGFLDKSLPHETRWQDYRELVDQYVENIDAILAPIHPANMQAIILGLDPQESLGVNAERYLGYRLGIGEYVFGIDPESTYATGIRAAEFVGSTALPLGEPDIYGSHNLEEHLARRVEGQFWRKSGIVSGIVDRRESLQNHAISQTTGVTAGSNEELWAEYYA
ncbi:MAG: hypothetical protein KIH63_005775 [Candidatus Saccharibacteria bacterium]|nr:hypothetical protein [Candidatus Saccharibacteria bacterium]